MTNKIMIIACALLCLVGCKDKKDEPNSLIGNIEKPDWVAITDYDLTSSMTAVIRVDLSLSFPEEQLRAANYQPSEDDMLAVYDEKTVLSRGTKRGWVWYVYSAAPIDKTPSNVTLRYYSASLKNIFVSKELIPYKNDTQLGTTDDPYTPTFVVDQ